MTLLSFDYGERRTGVAVGQTITGTATPLRALQLANHEPYWLAIKNLIDTWQPRALIVGLPRLKSRHNTKIEQMIRCFCDLLQQKFSLPVYTWDESYSSTEAYQRLRTLRQSGRAKKITKGQIDSLAAAIILESWMARVGSQPHPKE